MTYSSLLLRAPAVLPKTGLHILPYLTQSKQIKSPAITQVPRCEPQVPPISISWPLGKKAQCFLPVRGLRPYHQWSRRIARSSRLFRRSCAIVGRMCVNSGAPAKRNPSRILCVSARRLNRVVSIMTKLAELSCLFFLMALSRPIAALASFLLPRWP